MGVARWHPIERAATAVLVAVLALVVLLPLGPAPAATQDEQIALSLASMLRAARTVISANQALINDPNVGDKGLTGEAVVAKAIENYKAATGTDPRELDPKSRHGRLIAAQLEAVEEVMAENQALINAEGRGFKGFVPAVFARLVNERFAEKVGEEARIKVTAPPSLVRNRKARPDDWEAQQIKEQLQAADWPEGQIVSAQTELNGGDAFRVLVPEYYTEGCLSCHGEPAGELDVTGYPKEGGQLGDLGGAISITLFQ